VAVDDGALQKAFADLWINSLELNWIPARLGVKRSASYTIDVPGKTGYVYVSLGVNGERGESIAYDGVGVAAIGWQEIKLRREQGRLVVREAQSAGGGGGGSTTLVGLSDTVFTGLADGDILSYDSATGNWVNFTPSGSTGDAPSPHALDSVHHSGQLANTQFLNALLRDGTRSLTGNLTVTAGVTIDGVDLSAHAANPAAHHDPVTAGNGIAVSTQVVSVDLATDPGLEFSSGNLRVKLLTGMTAMARDATGLYIDNSIAGSGLGINTTTKALSVNVSNGLEINTDNVRVNQAFAFTWTGTHSHAALSTFNGGATFNSGTFRFNTDPQLNSNLDFIGGDRLITGSGDITLDPADDLILSAGGFVIVNDDQEIRTVAIQDLPVGIQGIRLWERTDAVNYWQLTMGAIRVDELYARVFVADETRVDRGEEYWSKSYGIVEEDFTLPALGATVDVWFEDAPSSGTANLFSVGDWLLFRIINWGTGIVIAKFWMQVADAGVNDYVQKDATNKRQQWRLTYKKFGSPGLKVKKGALGLDAGQVGQGWIHLSALNQGAGPFIQIGIFTSVVADEPQFTPYTRMGNLSGTVDYGATNAYGFVTGTNLGVQPEDGFSGVTSDSVQGVRLFNTDFYLYGGATLEASITRDEGIELLQDDGSGTNDRRYITWLSNLDGSGVVRSSIRSYSDAPNFNYFKHSVIGGTGGWGELRLSAGAGTRSAYFYVAADDITAPGGYLQAESDEARLYIDNAAFVSPKTASISGTGVPVSPWHFYESSTATGTTGGITVEQASTGDAVVQFLLSGGQRYVMGIDNSAGDVFAIATGTGLATGTFLVHNPATGRVSLADIEGPQTIVEDGATASLLVDAYGTTVDARLVLYSARGTLASPSATLSGDTLGAIYFQGFDTSRSSGAQIYAIAAGEWGTLGDTTDSPTDLRFATVTEGAGTLVDKVAITHAGSLGVGLMAPVAKLHVYNNNSSTDGGIGTTIEQAGAGDAKLHFVISDQVFSMGIDNSDGNKLKMAVGYELGTAPFFSVDPATGNVTITGLTVEGGGSIHDPATAGDGISVALQVISVDGTVVRTTRTVTAGTGLTGGGALSANITLNVGAGDGITVAADSVAVDSTVVRTTLDLVAGNGLTGGGTLAASRTFHVGAGDGITVNANDVALASSVAGNGLAYSAGVLSVNVGTGIAIVTDTVTLASTVAGAGLTFTTGVLAVGAGDGITVAADSVALASSVAGTGLAYASGVLSVNAATGLTTSGDNVILASTVAGTGLTYSTGVLSVDTGDGITTLGDSVVLDLAYSPDWTGVHSFAADPQLSANLDFLGTRSITSNGTNSLTIAAGGNLYLASAGDLARTVSFDDLVSGINGFRLWDTGAGVVQMTLSKMRMDSLYARAFIADLVRVDIGSEYWSKSSGIVQTDFDIPALSATVDVWFEDNAHTAVAGAQIFSLNDWLMFRIINMSTDITVQFFWMQVTAFLSTGTNRQRWRLTHMSGGTPGTTVRAGAVCVDVGQSGQGWVHLSALRENDGPFIQVGDWTGSDPIGTFTNRVRMGNLKGTVDYGATDAWGFAAGNSLGLAPDAGFSGFTADADGGLRMFNTDIEIYESTTKALTLTKLSGLRLLQDVAEGTNDTRFIAWYDDLDPLGNVASTIESYDVDINNERRLSLSVYSKAGVGELSALYLSATQDSPVESNFISILSTGAITLSGDVVTVSGALGVTGASTLASLGVTANATVGGTLGVTGAATLSSTLAVTTSVTTPLVKAASAAGLRLEDDGGNGIFVEDGGNVGIGIADPAWQLHLFGSATGGTNNTTENDNANGFSVVRVTNNSGHLFQFISWGSTFAGSSLGETRAGKGMVQWTGTSPMVLGTSDTGGAADLGFVTANTRRMTILSGGQVGIANSTPTANEADSRLTVRVSSSGNVHTSVENSSSGEVGTVWRRTGTTPSRWLARVPSGTDTFAFYSDTLTRDALTLSSNGYVGVNTTNPGINIVGTYEYATATTTVFHVNNGNDARVVITGGGTLGDAGLDLIDQGATANSRWMQLLNSAGYTRFRSMSDAAGNTMDNILLMEHSTGRIGLRETTPGAWLDMAVAGGGVAGYRANVVGDSGAVHFAGRRARGTVGSETQVTTGASLLTIGAQGYHSGGAYGSNYVAQIAFNAAQNFTATAQGTEIVFFTTPTTTSVTPAQAMAIGPEGVYARVVSTRQVYVDSSGYLGTTSSSARFKTDIVSLPDSYATRFIDHLRPVTYKDKNDERGIVQLGLIAEEVDELGATELVDYDPDGTIHSVKYDRLVVMLIAELQSLRRRMTKLEERLH
jgi:hypothetical protein